MTNKIALSVYEKTLKEIKKTVQKAEKNIIHAVGRQKIEMCWQVGKIIEEYLLENKRAEYGVGFLENISKDTGIAQKTLYQMQGFYKTYPILPEDREGLNWSHYRSLSSIKNEDQRNYFENLTIENALSSNNLQSEISKLKPRSEKDSNKDSEKDSKSQNEKLKNQKNTLKKLKVTRGKLFTYKLSTFPDSTKIFIDCGFNLFTEVKTDLKPSDGIIESVKNSENFSFRKSEVSSRKMHCYKAFLDRVVDGDTIIVTLDLGFNNRHKEILRLAKINSAESDSLDGKRATKELKKILNNAPFLIVKTNKTDIYGRYIADVFLGTDGEKNIQKTADEGVYLNQLLLDRGLAQAY